MEIQTTYVRFNDAVSVIPNNIMCSESERTKEVVVTRFEVPVFVEGLW
jgi:hypothetical protein